MVDTEQLFSLAQDAEIETFPSILLVKGRKIIDRLEGIFTKNQLEQKLLSYVNQKF